MERAWRVKILTHINMRALAGSSFEFSSHGHTYALNNPIDVFDQLGSKQREHLHEHLLHTAILYISLSLPANERKVYLSYTIRCFQRETRTESHKN